MNGMQMLSRLLLWSLWHGVSMQMLGQPMSPSVTVKVVAWASPSPRAAVCLWLRPSGICRSLSEEDCQKKGRHQQGAGSTVLLLLWLCVARCH